MQRTYRSCLPLLLLISSSSAAVYAQPPCSTEKVNHRDCTFTINRLYPVGFPTIQMSHGAKVIVQLQNPLAFETVTLDQTSASLFPGTDQGATLLGSVTSILPGHVLSSVTIPALIPPAAAAKAAITRKTAVPDELKVLAELQDLQQRLENAGGTIDGVFRDSSVVYAQLSQVMSPLPRPAAGPSGLPPPPAVDINTPNPWANFTVWRAYLLCELVGGFDCVTNPMPSFNNVLGEIGSLQNGLLGATATTPPTPLLFDQKAFDAIVTTTSADIHALPQGGPQYLTDVLNEFIAEENRLISVIGSLTTTLSGPLKDFQTYYQTIQLALALPTQSDLGEIIDPSTSSDKYPRFLGRQLSFSVNVVNRIATSLASVTTASVKTPITTFTVLYADPRFETSTGVLFNFVHNRTFGTQTIVTPAAGTSQVAGEIQISETKTRPDVVPFVAGHVRLGNDFIVPIDHRRGAIYATGWIGLNPYNTLPEYGFGPTFSWRSIMLSALYDRTHDTRLTQGAYVGQILCTPNPPTGSTLPSCATPPASPTTQTFGTNAFAFGISVRFPTVFAAATSGVSR